MQSNLVSGIYPDSGFIQVSGIYLRSQDHFAIPSVSLTKPRCHLDCSVYVRNQECTAGATKYATKYDTKYAANYATECATN